MLTRLHFSPQKDYLDLNQEPMKEVTYICSASKKKFFQAFNQQLELCIINFTLASYLLKLIFYLRNENIYSILLQAIDFGGVFNSAVFIYANIFSNFSIDSLLAQMQLIMLIKTIYFILSSFLPIEGFVNTIFSPFSYIHQIFHAHAAKKLNNKYRDETGRPISFIRMNASLGNASFRSKEYSNVSFMISNESAMTIRDVMYFANSSTVPSFVMILAIVSVGPLMQEFFFAIIHFYILCGIVLCLMPSKADSKLIINYILIRTEISGWYIINIFIVFILTAGTYSLKYYYLNYFPPYWVVEPLLMGVWSVVMYLLFFGIIVTMTEEKRLFPVKKGFVRQSQDEVLTEEEQELLNEIDVTT